MLLLMGELLEATRDCHRSVDVIELHQRLDKVGSDRERSRVVYALALGVLPDHAQALRPSLRLTRQERSDTTHPPRLEHVPALALRLSQGDHLSGVLLGLVSATLEHGEQCLAARAGPVHVLERDPFLP